MDGLKSIQDRILEQAREKAEEIETASLEQCNEIIKEAEAECAAILSEAREKADAQAQAMINRARSLAAMEERKNNLQQRQKLIDTVLGKALENVCKLSSDKKLELYKSMINTVGAEKGIITLASKDLALAESLINSIGQSFEISDKAGIFAGGLILRRDKIEDNLTFDLIVRNNRPQLSALAAKALPHDLVSDKKE